MLHFNKVRVDRVVQKGRPVGHMKGETEMKFRVAAVAATLAVTVLTGCGAGGGAAGGMSSPGTTTSGSAATHSGAPVVTVKNGAFSSKSLTVKTGTAVKFVFDGMGKDRFVIVGGAKSPTVSPGQSWTYVFRHPGSFTVEMNAMTYIKMKVSVK